MSLYLCIMKLEIKKARDTMDREEQTFLGKVLFTFDGCDDLDIALLQFYDVEFPFESMKQYNGMTVTLQIDGTMEIYDKDNNIVWGSAFPTDIEEWDQF